MNLLKISELEPTSAIVIYTDAVKTTVAQAIEQKKIGENGWAFNKEKASLLTHIYAAETLGTPGKIRSLHVKAKVHVTSVVDDPKGVIFEIDTVEPVDFLVNARFGDVRRSFMYCDDYHLDITIKQREQNNKLITQLKADPEAARKFLASCKPKDIKIPTESVPTLVAHFLELLVPGADVTLIGSNLFTNVPWYRQQNTIN